MKPWVNYETLETYEAQGYFYIIKNETVWLNLEQMSELFDRDKSVISRHIKNALNEKLKDEVVIAKFVTTTKHGAIEGKTQTHLVEFYDLDMIISVGYRVKFHKYFRFLIYKIFMI